MIIPVGDDNEEGRAVRHRNLVHYGIIVTCVIVFFYELYLGSSGGPDALKAWVDHWSFDPRVLGGGFLKLSFLQRSLMLAKYLSDVKNHGILRMAASTFMHGGWQHIFANMVVLWLLGNSVEYAMGHIRYLLFFLLAGVISSFGDTIFATPASFLPGIGASGAIMAVAGAYMFYFPRATITFFIFWGFSDRHMGFYTWPARAVIGVYFGLQAVMAWQGWGTNYDHIGVWAHITGFLAGVALAWPLRKDRDGEDPLEMPASQRSYRLSIEKIMEKRRQRR